METRARHSPQLSIGFSCAAHSMMHLLAAVFLTAVLGIERAWDQDYDRLLKLWTLGSFLLGLGAPAAGWLSDRWSQSRMIVLFFGLTGLGGILAALATGPLGLMLGLAVLGLGGSIYHPVGIAWVVRNADNPGRVLGINGIFGAVGVGLAAIVAGSLTSWIDWRAAFWIPGLLSILMGLALWALIALGYIVDPGRDRNPQPQAAKGDRMRAFFVLSVTMLCAGLLFQSLQTAMPKIVAVDMRGLLGLAAGEAADTARIGTLVTIIYLLTSGAQVLGGMAADRFEPRRVYVVALAIQVPAVLLATQMADLPLFVALTALIFMNSMQLPAETVLLSRYTPEKHRGFAFGLKFVLSFASGPVAVWLVAATFGARGDFLVLLLSLGALATVAAIASWLLPQPRRDFTAQPA